MANKVKSKRAQQQRTLLSGKNQKRKPKTRKRKSNRVLYYILLFGVLSITLIVLSLTVLFKIENITIIGNKYYEDDDIIKVATITKGENLFLTSTKDIPELLTTQFPYIESAKVKKVLPPGIEITVTPSVISAALEIGESDFALISDKGKILERGLVLLPHDVILVKGFEIGEKQPGEVLGVYKPLPTEEGDTPAIKEKNEMIKAENLNREQAAEQEDGSLKVIKYLNEAVKETEFTSLTNLDVSNQHNMTVVFENRLLLELGTEMKLEYKLRFLKTVIAKLPPDARGTLVAQNAPQDIETVFKPAEDYFVQIVDGAVVKVEENPEEDSLTLTSTDDTGDEVVREEDGVVGGEGVTTE